MRAVILEIMECWPPVVRLGTAGGETDYDTSEKLLVERDGEFIPVRNLSSGMSVDVQLVDGVIQKIFVLTQG